MIRLDGMLMIGAVGSNVGKTELACALLKKFSCEREVTGIKVTTIKSKDGQCPKGGEGCGVCASMDGSYIVTEETDASLDKDTARLLRAGASRVLWMRVVEGHLEEGLKCLLDVIGRDRVCLCESNSLRKVVEPDVFLIVRGQKEVKWKSSSQQVRSFADAVVTSDGNGFDFDIDRISLVDGKWAVRHEATAIIMAGGNSSRMGRDKSMLMLDGKPMIERVYLQLRPHFDEVLISSNEGSKYGFLGLKVVPDSESGRGPLMGIASALAVSGSERNLVVACDIPEVNMYLARRLLRESRDCDVVLARTGPSKVEPLFAVYKRSLLPAMEETLSGGRNKILDAFFDCKIKYVDTEELTNINTMSDY